MELLNNYARKNYGYVNEKSVIICPHCGKVMKLLPKKNWSSYKYYYDGNEDSWGSWETARTETFICEDCGIKYKNKICKEEEDTHWILPKGFKSTCTQKQVNYARVLWNKLFRQPYWEEDNLYVTSTEQASKAIGDLLVAIEKRDNRAAFRNGIIDTLTLAGFGYASGYLHPDNTTTEVWKDDVAKDYATYKMNWETKTVSFTVNLHFENSVEITPEIVEILETVKANKETIEEILKGDY